MGNLGLIGIFGLIRPLTPFAPITVMVAVQLALLQICWKDAILVLNVKKNLPR